MDDKKIVSAYIYDPSKSLFKAPVNEKAEASITYCNNSDKCQLHARGQCIFSNPFGSPCPYGIKRHETGLTRRARGYRKWIADKEEQLKGIPTLSSPPAKIATIGDYIYLPYPHMDMNTEVPFLKHAMLLSSGRPFILISDFTEDIINNIVTFKPIALNRSVITQYFDKVVPIFLRHLGEAMPDLYQSTIEKYPYIDKIVGNSNFTNIGRKALLHTLTPNVGFIDEKWVWDGTTLSSDSYKSAFFPVKGDTKITIVPDKNAKVKITDESQVNSETIFED